MMEIAKGYQQTEVGIIPIDWKVKELSQIVERERPISYGIVQTGKYIENGIRCIRVLDILNGKINNNNLIRTSEEISSSYRRTILRTGDIVIALRGKIGELAVIEKDLTGANLTRGLALIAAIEENYNYFLYYYLSSPQSKLILEKNLNGSALKEIPIGVLRKISVPLPPTREEQKAIAQALSDADAAIAELDRLITKKRNIKQGTMQQLLTGKKRLAGFSQEKPYKQTDIGVIPENWDVISIQTALDEKYIEDQMDGNHGELYPKSHEFVSYGVPYVGANDFWGGRVSFKNCKFLSEERARKFKKGIARNGDVLFAHNATVGPVAILNFEGNFLIVSTTVTYFRCNPDKLYKLYFRYVLEAQYFVKQYSAVMAQSTRFQVPITIQRKFLIAVPKLTEQKAIAQVLSDMDTEIEALEQKRHKYKAIKQGMMQELLTGRTRLI